MLCCVGWAVFLGSCLKHDRRWFVAGELAFETGAPSKLIDCEDANWFTSFFTINLMLVDDETILEKERLWEEYGSCWKAQCWILSCHFLLPSFCLTFRSTVQVNIRHLYLEFLFSSVWFNCHPFFSPLVSSDLFQKTLKSVKFFGWSNLYPLHIFLSYQFILLQKTNHKTLSWTNNHKKVS